MKSSILIIYTGGTIGMKNDAETGALVLTSIQIPSFILSALSYSFKAR